MSETEAQTTKKRTKKDDYIVQGSILAAAAVLTKIIGVVYRIPLTNILGDEGNGFYGYAYQVYAIALMISSFSLPTAVSKLVSIRLAKRQRRNAFRVFICSLAFAIGVGLFISLTIFLGAGLISTHLMKSPLSVYALRVLAPGLLIVAVMAVIRGYFQGMGTMLPTAISQIIEQYCRRKCPLWHRNKSRRKIRRGASRTCLRCCRKYTWNGCRLFIWIAISFVCHFFI